MRHELKWNVRIQATDDQDYNEEYRCRTKEGPGDVTQLFSGIGTVHARRFIKFGRNRLQSRQKNNGCPADSFPDIQQNDWHESQDWIGKPKDVFWNYMEHIVESIIHEPGLAVEHIFKQQADDDPRSDYWQVICHSKKCTPWQALIEQESHAKSKKQFDDYCNNRIHKRIEHGASKNGVG